MQFSDQSCAPPLLEATLGLEPDLFSAGAVVFGPAEAQPDRAIETAKTASKPDPARREMFLTFIFFLVLVFD
jgi:hypothetical protein